VFGVSFSIVTYSAVQTQAMGVLNKYAAGRGNANPIAPFSSERGASVLEQYSHIVLTDYLGGKLPMPGAVCPEDAARLEWSRNALHSEQWIRQPGTDTGASQPHPQNKTNRNWFAYSSSYQLIPAACFRDLSKGYFVYVQGKNQDLYDLSG